MGAIIDRDWLCGPENGDSLPTRKGINWDGGIEEPATAIRFRLRDDDGNTYYGGLIDYADVFERDDELDLAVQDFGRYDAGAVSIEMRCKDLPDALVEQHKKLGCVTRDGLWMTLYGLPSSETPWDDEVLEWIRIDKESYED